MGSSADKANLSFTSMVAAGKFDGWSARMKFGGCLCPTTAERLVTTTAKFLLSDYEGWLETSDYLRVRAGGNAADGVAGAGALTIRIYGLDTNWDETYEDVTLAGIAASALTTQKFIRQYRTKVLTVGTRGASNVGPITVETAGGLEMTNIPIGLGQTQSVIIATPRDVDFQGYVMDVSVDSGKTATFIVKVRQEADNTADHRPWRTIYTAAGIAGGTQSIISIPWPIRFPGKMDIAVTVIPSAINATVHVALSGHTMPDGTEGV